MDTYLRQSLKNWASEHQPQAKGRARLLLVAASIQPEQSTVRKLRDQKDKLQNPHPSSIHQAMEIYNLPWIWVAQVTLTPMRSVT